MDTKTFLLTLELPEEVFRKYEAEAAALSKPVADLLTERLAKCQRHSSIQPLYFDDSQRQDLEKLLCHQLRTAKDVLHHIQRTQGLRLGPFHIPLNTQVLARLKTRTFGHPLQEVIERETLRAIEVQVGLR